MTHVEDFTRGNGRDILRVDITTEIPVVEMYGRLAWEHSGTCTGHGCWPRRSR
jgi:hypothetical protein